MMNRKRRKISMFTILLFVIGLVIYLMGLLLLFGSGFSRTKFANLLFSDFSFGFSTIRNMKVVGAILFVVGFILFMISIVLLYKNDEIKEDNKNLIIEGKADVITIIVMTYVMMFMVVICLIYNELVGALLFGITIIIQSVLNSLLIRFYNKNYRKK